MSERDNSGIEEQLADAQASVQAFVEQAVARTQKSVALATAAPQPVGLTPKEVLY